MRIRVSHETTYRYEQPPKGVIQTLRMTPRNHDGQYVVNWRIDISADCRLDAQAEAFALKRGVCQDLTHIFIAAARELGFPARYVGGYFHRNDGVTRQQAGHAWAEAFIPSFGWVAFDPANGICATDAHVRVAVGLDYLGAAPVRGARYGGGAQQLTVAVVVDQAPRQMQN